MNKSIVTAKDRVNDKLHREEFSYGFLLGSQLSEAMERMIHLPSCHSSHRAGWHSKSFDQVVVAAHIATSEMKSDFDIERCAKITSFNEENFRMDLSSAQIWPKQASNRTFGRVDGCRRSEDEAKRRKAVTTSSLCTDHRAR